MCEIDWGIVQKFVSCLIWPAIVLTLFFTFKGQLTKLVNRIANESNSIDMGGLLKVQFKQIEKLKDDIKSGQIPTIEQAKNVISATVALQIDGIKLLGEEYINSTYDKRRIIEIKINEYSVGLTTEDIKLLFDSENTGHRIAAAIALDPILEKDKKDPADIPEIRKFIVESLKDNSSFLRYESLQLVFESKKLKTELSDQLDKMKTKDENSAIRNIIKLYTK